ncbi:DUF4124 domain-containing protein [Acidovorax sp. KKS102]|uniref:DUF4124 domain-containing protein n=1 Tax=Acidovorax sp. KKS102 TaxID=358220 RepID=UPI000A076B3C|nr:DUF4124 domain-containing protein [Acidovorax sp. KKS102]
MNIRHAIAILSAAAALFASTAHAQVHRCQDQAGKIIYSDRPCAQGQQGGQIERQRSREEILRERQEAYDAEMRKQQRNAAEQEREWNARQGQMVPPAIATQQGQESWQARKERENAATSANSITNKQGRWNTKPEAEHKDDARRRAAQTTLQPILTHCDKAFCYDNHGGVYHKAGPDFMTSPTGRPCHRAGTVWNCN